MKNAINFFKDYRQIALLMSILGESAHFLKNISLVFEKLGFCLLSIYYTYVCGKIAYQMYLIHNKKIIIGERELKK